MPAFTVDLDRLDATVSLLAARTAAVEELLTDLDGRIAALHTAWSGVASQAQLEAHHRFLTGATEMRDGLAAMRAAAAASHGNYTSAVEANLAMWA